MVFSKLQDQNNIVELKVINWRKKDENIVKQTIDKGRLYASKGQKNNYYSDYFTKGIQGNRK